MSGNQIKFAIQKSQRDAAYDAVLEIFKENGIAFNNFTPAKNLLNSELRQRVYEIIESKLMDGKVFLKPTENNQKKIDDPKELRTYVIGLLNNWLRKHPRLNGSGNK